MDEITRLIATTLTDTETSLYTDINGAVVKTIMMHNSNTTSKDVTLKLDSVTFLFTLNAKEIKIIDTPIFTNDIKANGNGVNIHISGIQLGGV